MVQPVSEMSASVGRPRKVRQRTCVGCGKVDAPSNLLRLVLGPGGQVAFDLANHATGRSAHLHPSAACFVPAARKGLSRAFRANVACDPALLVEELQRAVERRLLGLFGSALRSGNAVIGRMNVDVELGANSIELVVMACNANDSPSQSLMKAVDEGRVVAWGSTAQLGAALGCGDVAVVGVRSPSLGKAIADVCRIADSVRSCSEVR